MPFTFDVGSSSTLRVTSADTERLRCEESCLISRPGSKSEKLAEAFESEGGGRLDQESVKKMLEEVLFGLSRLCVEGCVSDDDVRQECEELAADVGSATFDEFGSWYNARGFERAPWLELLDVEKWPRTIAFEIEIRDDSKDDCPTSLRRTEFSSLALSRVRAVAVGSGLFETQRVHFADDKIESNTFLKGMSQHNFDGERKLVFDLLFEVFRKNDENWAPADELSAGLSIFCSGSKSEKLATNWDIINSTTSSSNKSVQRQGALSRHGLKRFLRSFLVVLLALARDDQRGHNRDELRDDADSAAATVAAEVFSQTEHQRPDQNFISFDDFADWYTQGGFRSASWLELLDLNKWVL